MIDLSFIVLAKPDRLTLSCCDRDYNSRSSSIDATLQAGKLSSVWYSLYATANTSEFGDRAEAVVIVDRSHTLWAILTTVLALFSIALYVVYLQYAPNGPMGGSWQGMLFGIAGSACMIYAGLLAWRKKVPKWRGATAQTWLRAHIWIGLLSVPLILCHSGFRWGGGLELLLMITFAVVIVSGIYGLALQQLLPRLLSTTAPAQAIAPQISVACEKLRQSVEANVQQKCGEAFLWPLSSDDDRSRYSPKFELALFYWKQLASFLSADATGRHDLANPTLAAARFARLRESVSEDLLSVVDELQFACDERRQLLTQLRIQGWLHGWLSIHVPLSVTLLVFGIIHVVMSIYY